MCSHAGQETFRCLTYPITRLKSSVPRSHFRRLHFQLGLRKLLVARMQNYAEGDRIAASPFHSCSARGLIERRLRRAVTANLSRERAGKHKDHLLFRTTNPIRPGLAIITTTAKARQIFFITAFPRSSKQPFSTCSNRCWPHTIALTPASHPS